MNDGRAGAPRASGVVGGCTRRARASFLLEAQARGPSPRRRQKFRQLDLQRPRQERDIVQRDVPLAALDRPDECTVKAGLVTEPFLRPAFQRP